MSARIAPNPAASKHELIHDMVGSGELSTSQMVWFRAGRCRARLVGLSRPGKPSASPVREEDEEEGNIKLIYWLTAYKRMAQLVKKKLKKIIKKLIRFRGWI